MDVFDVLKGDLEIFEISGSPLINVPKIARENAQKQVIIWPKIIYYKLISRSGYVCSCF